MQLALFQEQGQILKELGLQSVQINHESFIATAKSIARCLAYKNGRVTMDDVREVLDLLGIEPGHCNAFGAVFVGKDWHFIGWTKSKRPSNHARDLKIWSLKPATLDYLPPRKVEPEESKRWVGHKKRGRRGWE